MRSSWVEVDLSALRKNAEFIKSRLSPGTRLMAPVKGDGYGHGIIESSRVFDEAGASHFGVAIAEEGVELREGGIKKPILVFGYTFPDDYELLFEYSLMPNIFTLAQARELDAIARKRGVRLGAHISLDTGLARLGFSLNESAFAAIVEICSMKNLFIEGIFSQFATADEYPDSPFCREQFARFTSFCSRLENAGAHIPIKHICDSSATFFHPEMHMDMVRPGTALFGMYCWDTAISIPDIEVYPALALKSRLASIRPVPAGTPVGYYCTWTAPRETVLGIVPLGFVDGFSRLASNRGFVLVGGVRCPIVGNICMDQFTIDITAVPSPSIGDEIVLIGRQGDEEITIAEAASFADTFDTELSGRLGKRLPRRYTEK